MDRIVAFCGLVCTECPAYAATQAGDEKALEQVAEQWRKDYAAPTITVEGVRCDGCLGTGGRHCAHCSECEIRACGMRHGVRDCADCSKYPCTTLSAFFRMVPQAQATLDGIRTARRPAP